MFSVAAAYGSSGLKVEDRKAEAAEDDPLGIEAAFGKIDSTHPGVDVDDDPTALMLHSTPRSHALPERSAICHQSCHAHLRRNRIHPKTPATRA